MSTNRKNDDDATTTHLVMTGEGYRVEKRRPVEPGKWDYVAVIALLFLLALADKCH